MKKCLIFLLFVTLCISLCLTTADELSSQRGMKVTIHTKEGKAIPLYKDSYALVVGNGTYTDGWDPLPGALQDVTEVADVLKTHGFQVTLKKDLTAADFKRAFAGFVLNAGRDPDNRLLFYYAGHGYTQKTATGTDLGSLVMVDAPSPEKDGVGFKLSSVDMKALVTEAELIHSRHVLFVFDSCFSGTILNVRAQLDKPTNITDSIKHPVRQFITAGRAGEVVPDESVFKQTFLDLLAGRAPEPFPDGYITGAELGFYLKNQVPVYNKAQHPQYGKIRNPKLDKGDFVFVLQRMDIEPPGVGDSLSTIATLNVTSTPSGATVSIDGVQIGTTPLREYAVDTGARGAKQMVVVLEYEGYQRYQKRLTLRGGQSTPWDARLDRDPSLTATLTVTSTPIGATIYLDGVDIGKTPLRYHEIYTGANRAKQVEVELKHTDYIDIQKSLTLQAGRATSWRDARLEKIVKIVGNDGAEMVLIPAGDFHMGSNDPNEPTEEKPVHTVYVDAFYMDVYEVTNAQYKKFVDANPEWRKDRIPEKYADRDKSSYLGGWNGNNYPEGEGNHPVRVTWPGAMAYAQWAGKRLPTEAEWEKAARGGLVGKRYPWGDTIDLTKANFTFYTKPATFYTKPVGTYPPNGYGLYDMAGNVGEWCLDVYDSNFYANSPRRNPIAGGKSISTVNFTDRGTYVLRGGFWGEDARSAQITSRYWAMSPYTISGTFCGFRCVAAVIP